MRQRLGWQPLHPDYGITHTASFAPVISTTFNAVVRPEYGELQITEYPPILDISGHQGIVPGTAVLVITPYPPTAEQHSITPLPDLIYGFAIVAMGDSAGSGPKTGVLLYAAREAVPPCSLPGLVRG